MQKESKAHHMMKFAAVATKQSCQRAEIFFGVGFGFLLNNLEGEANFLGSLGELAQQKMMFWSAEDEVT